jgi:outer membrane protein TolC
MKSRPFIFLLLLPASLLHAQLTIDQCQEKARQNYPQIKQFALIEKSAEYHLSNAGKANLPQVTLSAKATYQSDAIHLTLPLPSGTVSIQQGKDQYQAVAEVTQTLYDGGITSTQKKIARANAETDKQKLEVELYALRDRVNQLFFGCLLIHEQLGQNATLQTELQTNLDKIKACQKNGVANQADVDAIRVELLNNAQRKTELKAAQTSYRDMLAALIGDVLPEEALLVKPSPVAVDLTQPLQRPELHLLDAQLQQLDNQNLMVETAFKPKIGLFIQGGYGRPGLNMLNSDFSPFYIGGVRFSWNISSLYTQKNNLGNIQVSKDWLNTQRETFLFNQQLKIKQQNTEIEKMRELLRTDDDIIQLRTSIKNACSVKVDNGVQTVTDLLREINVESMAKQQRSLHEIQLLLYTYNLENSTNN